MPSRPTLIFCLCKLTFLLTTLVLAASWSPLSTSCWCTPRLGMSTCDDYDYDDDNDDDYDDDDDDYDNDDDDDDTHLGHLLQRVCAVPSLLLEHRPHQLTILGHCAMVGVSKAGWTVDSSEQEVSQCPIVSSRCVLTLLHLLLQRVLVPVQAGEDRALLLHLGHAPLAGAGGHLAHVQRLQVPHGVGGTTCPLLLNTA